MGKSALAGFLIIIFSFLCIDGGSYFLFSGYEIQTYPCHNNLNDIEAPHQYHTVNFSDEEKWLETFSFDFSICNNNSVIFLYTADKTSREFSDSIWQPPKFV